MQYRCSHCKHFIELLVDDPLADINCPNCGSPFQLVDAQSTASYGRKPKRIAHFELLSQVGSGKFGTVWRARDTKLDRIVAIKIPRAGQLDAMESEQFLREARAASQVRHPNVVSIHEVGRDDDTVYIASEFIK